MKVTVLGCGGSLGVPLIGDYWGTCDPTEPRNRRRRPSILVEGEAATILVDTSPDLREQLILTRTSMIDAVLFTHSHADHTHGIDDLRPYFYRRHLPIPAYLDEPTLADLEQRFGYALTTVQMERGLYHPMLEPRLVDGSPVRVGDLTALPFIQDHGLSLSLGWRFGNLAYSTDVKALSEDAFEALEGTKVWIVDATREEPHASHAHLDLTLEWIERVGPERAYLTHMNHTMDYRTLLGRLPAGVEPAFDGLVIDL